MKPVSAYNHNVLGTASKPLIPNGEFRMLTERINSGDANINEWTDKWSLEPFQKQFIDNKLSGLKHLLAINAGHICPYCLQKTKFVDSIIIYRISYGMMYYCEQCSAWVGVHKGTDRALGRLADKNLREAKQKAHSYFDKLWLKKMKKGFSKNKARNSAYSWLSNRMKLPKSQTHIGMFDLQQCNQVIELCKEYFK